MDKDSTITSQDVPVEREPIQVGQVWRSKDKRENRAVRVVGFDTKCIERLVRGRFTKVEVPCVRCNVIGTPRTVKIRHDELVKRWTLQDWALQ